MKTFIAALLMLSMAVAVTVAMTLICHNAADRLYTATSAAYSADSSRRADAAAALRDEWEQKRCLFALTVNKSETERIDLLIDSLCELTLHSHGDDDYFGICRLLYDAFDRVKQLLGISAYSFF